MKRFTTNKTADEMSNHEMYYNDCYVKNHEAYMYYNNEVGEIKVREYIKTLLGMYPGNEEIISLEDDDFDVIMAEMFLDADDGGVSGIIAALYTHMSAKATLHDVLKDYEN